MPPTKQSSSRKRSFSRKKKNSRKPTNSKQPVEYMIQRGYKPNPLYISIPPDVNSDFEYEGNFITKEQLINLIHSNVDNVKVNEKKLEESDLILVPDVSMYLKKHKQANTTKIVKLENLPLCSRNRTQMEQFFYAFKNMLPYQVKARNIFDNSELKNLAAFLFFVNTKSFDSEQKVKELVQKWNKSNNTDQDKKFYLAMARFVFEEFSKSDKNLSESENEIIGRCENPMMSNRTVVDFENVFDNEDSNSIVTGQNEYNYNTKEYKNADADADDTGEFENTAEYWNSKRTKIVF